MSGVALSSFLNLSSLLQRLSVEERLLHGEFPIEIFRLLNVKRIGLGGNDALRGYLPKINWSSGLEWLDLCRCGFRGSILASFGNLTQLISLDLSKNELRGRIPDVFQNLSKLTSLRLFSCNLSGPVPESIFGMVRLMELLLSSNNLSGIIRSGKLSKLSSLEVIDLSHNSLLSLSTSGNDANHFFPRLQAVLFSSCSVRQFPNFFRKLEYLDLSNNMISGGISKWEAQGWEDLTALNLSLNFLTTLEQFLGQQLAILDLLSNMLQCQILSTCLILRTPNPHLFNDFLISGNNLTGNIPSSICNWSELTVLDLSRNNLSGTIPECIRNFSYLLAFVDLKMNNFYGNNNLADKFPHWLASLPSQVLILRSNISSLTHPIAYTLLRIANDLSPETSSQAPCPRNSSEI
ncbi:Detected protein of unknown function [Hibiscus syriacus]|uniref:Uncharacterized protein n=1 Tax=Hibiscus syriacus TaxID=106335 RepID=A0A6A2XZH5_HIBSY|nr:receptor-like protein 19 [Hibiscus syriacus]KAE8660304.1 Detected protein of unknown function [Hibiscus syriacus]